MTKSIEQVRNVGKKFAGIEAATRVGVKKGFPEEVGDQFQIGFGGRSQHTHALVARVLATAGVQDQFQFFSSVMVLVELGSRA